MTQEKYNTLHEILYGTFYFFHLLSLSLSASQHAKMRKWWHCHQWGTSCDILQHLEEFARLWHQSFWSNCESGVLHHCKMLLTCDVYPPSKMHSSHCIQITKHKRPCVSQLIIDLKCKSHKSSPPLWNAALSTHSQPVCVKTVQFQINNPKHAAVNQGLRL